MIWTFLRGVLIGFSIAAPVGPIGALCIRRTLTNGRAAGLVSGLGAATADATYGAVAGFGLTVISGELIGQQQWLRLVGGLFLCYLGVRTLRAAPASLAPEPMTRSGLVAAYGTTFLLTLTNPMTILLFAAIFAGLGIVVARDYASAALLVAGVFMGSALWWLILSSAAAAVRERLRPGMLRWISRGAGIVILAFGAIALFGLRGMRP